MHRAEKKNEKVSIKKITFYNKEKEETIDLLKNSRSRITTQFRAYDKDGNYDDSICAGNITISMRGFDLDHAFHVAKTATLDSDQTAFTYDVNDDATQIVCYNNDKRDQIKRLRLLNERITIQFRAYDEDGNYDNSNGKGTRTITMRGFTISEAFRVVKNGILMSEEVSHIFDID